MSTQHVLGSEDDASEEVHEIIFRRFVFKFVARKEWIPRDAALSWNSLVYCDKRTCSKWSVHLRRDSGGRSCKYTEDELYVSLCLHSTSLTTPAHVTCRFEVRSTDGDLERSTEFCSMLSVNSKTPEFMVKPLPTHSRLNEALIVIVTTKTELAARDSTEQGAETIPKFSADMLSLMKNQESSDVIIEVEGVAISAHKLILTTRSPVFAAMLRHDVREVAEGRIIIEDFDAQTVKEFLQFLYTAQSPEFTCESAIKLLRLSDKYQVTDMKHLCEEYLSTQIRISNAVHLLLLADQFSAHILRRRILQYASKHIRVLREDPEFGNLPKGTLTDLLWKVTSDN